jgi:transcriptional regulator with XRE-family HTH domain
MTNPDDATGRERDPAFGHLVSRAEKKQLALLLRRVREEAGITQGELAAELGVFQSVVSKIEAGDRDVEALELRAICTGLGTTLEAFARCLEEEWSGEEE